MIRKICLLTLTLALPFIGGCAQSVQNLPILATLHPITPSASTWAEIRLQVEDGRQELAEAGDPLSVDSIDNKVLAEKLYLMLENQLSHRGIRAVNGAGEHQLQVLVEEISHQSSDDLWQGYTYTQVKLSVVATTAQGRYQNSYQVNYSQPFHNNADDDEKKYLVSTAIFKASQKVLQDTKLIRFLTK